MSPLKVCSVLIAMALPLSSFEAPQAAMPVNVWVPLTPTYSGAPDGGRIWPMAWNNLGVYDPASQRTIVFDRWLDPVRGDTIYANGLLACDPGANAVRVLKLTNWFSGPVHTDPLPANATDPTPVDRHPLGSLALVPSTHSVYLVNGLNQSAPGGHPTDTWKFDLNAGSWSKVADPSTGPHPPNYDSSSPAVMIYDPAWNKVVYLSTTYFTGTDTWLLDPATDQWSALPKDPSSATANVSASGVAYDSRRNRIVTFGGGIEYNSSSTRLWSYSPSQNKWSALADAPIAASAPGFAYDSLHDVFLALVGTMTLIYNPQTDRWSDVSTPIERGIQRWQSVTYNVAQDLFVHQGGDWSQPRWNTFRYGGPPAADTTPPSIPAGLTATAATSSRIDLTWAASSDNVGVTGYRVFRDGAVVATVTAGTSLQDEGLSASTSYSYAVAALDGAGNVSNVSASTSATTLPPAGSPPADPGAGGKSGAPDRRCGLLGPEGLLVLLLGMCRRLRFPRKSG